MGSTTLFKAVFINPEQVVRFYACNQKRLSCNKFVDILHRADIRMRSHGLRQLVDDKSVAVVIHGLAASCFYKFELVFK